MSRLCEHGKVYCDECGIAPITGTPVNGRLAQLAEATDLNPVK